MNYPDNFDSLAFDRMTRPVITHADCREYEDTLSAIESLEALLRRVNEIEDHIDRDCGDDEAAREAWSEARNEAEHAVWNALKRMKEELACIEARFSEADVELPL